MMLLTLTEASGTALRGENSGFSPVGLVIPLMTAGVVILTGTRTARGLLIVALDLGAMPSVVEMVGSML